MYNTPQYDFLLHKGSALFGPHFRLYPTDRLLIQTLLAYFLRNKEQSSGFNICLRKGILLTGPVGVGKTSLMTLMRLLLPPVECFAVKSCREVSFEFIKDGYPIIQKYSSRSFSSTYPIIYDPNHPITYCFDDLGAESALK